MMTSTLQLAMLLALVCYFCVLFWLLKKNCISLKYTLLWLFSGLLMTVLVVLPGILDVVSGLLGIYEPTNALFAILFFCIIIILMSMTAIVSKMNEKLKQVIQYTAMLERKVRELESENKKNT